MKPHGGRQTEDLVCVGRHVDDHVGHRGGHHQRTDHEEHRQLLGPEYLADRGRRGLSRFGGADEFGGLRDMAADHVPHRADQQADDEGNAPAPGIQLRSGEAQAEYGAACRGQQCRQALRGELPTRHESPPVGGLFGQKCRRAAELTTSRESLEQTGRQNQ